ncbi:hypothetical protein [Paenibacillus sp. HJGM_3]|uniref:hypothetical protein n=1 Tax=Paenibacillus sp. HJGM_3 TaxID=3379816 RepID=UPI00385A6756
MKIKYMLDELFRTIDEIDTHSTEEENVQHVRKRLILERPYFVYLLRRERLRQVHGNG